MKAMLSKISGITNYSKTKDVYDAYRRSCYSRKFFEANKEALTLHKAAKTAFYELGGKKLPKYKDSRKSMLKS